MYCTQLKTAQIFSSSRFIFDLYSNFGGLSECRISHAPIPCRGPTSTDRLYMHINALICTLEEEKCENYRNIRATSDGQLQK